MMGNQASLRRAIMLDVPYRQRLTRMPITALCAALGAKWLRRHDSMSPAVHSL